ncbi:MAG: DUF551 domain-containing protein [Clostridium sp.]|nr:DUF551 domain-containing protein [Clostridium sp.]
MDKKGNRMGDLIIRQAAIDAIMCEPTDAHYPSWYAERLKQLPTAQQWIPCSERLPEEEKAYLVTFACEKVGMSSWHKDTFNRGFNRGFDAYLTGVTEDGECEYFGVVAWMEKPEPWKGEEHGTSRAVLSQKPVR